MLKPQKTGILQFFRLSIVMGERYQKEEEQPDNIGIDIVAIGAFIILMVFLIFSFWDQIKGRVQDVFFWFS